MWNLFFLNLSNSQACLKAETVIQDIHENTFYLNTSITIFNQKSWKNYLIKGREFQCQIYSSDNHLGVKLTNKFRMIFQCKNNRCLSEVEERLATLINKGTHLIGWLSTTEERLVYCLYDASNIILLFYVLNITHITKI